MKKTTEKALERAQHILTRVFIDRKRSITAAMLEEGRAIIRECKGSTTAAYLYNYYVSICQVPSWDLTDDTRVAKQVGLTSRQVADNRRLLTKLGWVRFDTHKHNNVKYGLWYIGKEVVAATINRETNLDDYNELGLLTDEETKIIKDLGCESFPEKIEE